MPGKNSRESRTISEPAAGKPTDSGAADSKDAAEKRLEEASLADITANVDWCCGEMASAIHDINVASARIAFSKMMIINIHVKLSYQYIKDVGDCGGDERYGNMDNCYRDTIDIYSRVLDVFNKAEPAGIELKLDNAYYYACRGRAYLSLGEYDSAIADLKAALKIFPKDIYLGSAYKTVEDYTSAIADLEAALKAELKDKYAEERFESVCEEMGW